MLTKLKIVETVFKTEIHIQTYFAASIQNSTVNKVNLINPVKFKP